MTDDEVNRDEMNRDDIAKRAMELAARAEELARNAHETANIEEQLGQLEAELASLDAEEARLGIDDIGIDDIGVDVPSREDAREQTADDTPPWASHFTERMGSLGDRIGSLIEHVTDSAMQSLDVRLESRLAREADADVDRKTIPVDGTPTVLVQSRGGSIRVQAHDESTVAVTATGRRSGDEPLVEVEHENDTVRITTPRSLSRRTHGVRLELLVPRGSELTLGTGGGSVRVDGVAGQVAVRTGGGGISVTGVRGSSTFSTGGGSVELTDVDAHVTLRTGAGSVTVEGRLTGASSLVTGGGSIAVRLREKTNISVAARGTSAYAVVDGLTAHNGRISGQIGDGSDGHLDAKTGGGSVRITR